MFVCTSKNKAVIICINEMWLCGLWMIQWKSSSYIMFKHTGIKCTDIICSPFGSSCYFNILILSQRLVYIPYMYTQYFLKPKIHLHVFLHYFWKCVILIIKSMIIVRFFDKKKRYWVYMYICQLLCGNVFMIGIL